MQGEFAGVILFNVGPGGGEVEAEGFTVEFLGDVDGGAGAAHGVENGVAFAGVAGEELPDDPGRSCSDVIFVAVGFAAVVLGGVFPEGGGSSECERRFAGASRSPAHL